MSTLIESARPAAATELDLAGVLADVVGVAHVPAESHFFDDLGADSLVMARFCARARKHPDLPSPTIKDVYRYPTITALAAALRDGAPSAVEPSPASAATPPGSTPRYVLCGALQLLVFVGYSFLAALVVARGYEWIAGGTGPAQVYLRSAVFGAAAFVGLCTLPIAVKWLLVGRWQATEIRVWSLGYVRFWVVKTLVQRNPLLLFAGSPLYVLYLRALGARIGRGVVIFSRSVPVCTDLLTIGDGTVVRKDSFLACYRAHAGVIQTGTVTLGRDVTVGEMTVLDIETSLGDGAQLGHASSLHRGQAVPDGERWHGSPAQRTDVDYRMVRARQCGSLRRACYTVVQLLILLVVSLPLGISGVALLFAEVPQLAALLDPGPLALTSGTFYRDALIASVVLFVGSLLVGLLVAMVVPRVLALAVRPGRVYRLYGLHYGIHRTVARMTNLRFFLTLFGDSSAVVHYLRCLGYDLDRVEQTGSNFGTALKHETPYQCTVGRGTMVADGLSLINADFSSTSFQVSRTSIGAHNFLGNHIAYPAQGRTGENCLLATKVMVPVDGGIREGVGLLGSPCFEIPRTVDRDRSLDQPWSGDARRRGLAGKNRHNAVTAGLFLLARWIHVFGMTLLAMAAAELYAELGAAVIVLANVLILLFTVAFFVLVERASTGFRPLQPLNCSMYELAFWRHERFWKAAATGYNQAFNGTPFKNVVWRLQGVRIGRRVFDDGCGMPEKTLVTIGDDVTLNAGSIVQCHSQEDGAFKSDRIAIGNGVTVGTGAWVHYGVTIGDGAVLAPDSFLMKGEEVPPHERWGGNPARQLPTVDPVASPLCTGHALVPSGGTR